MDEPVVIEQRFKGTSDAVVGVVLILLAAGLFTAYWRYAIVGAVFFFLGIVAVIADPPKVKGE